MDKAQISPFERNRYYYGKMLTSADFQAEQQYMNQKRQFLNQMVLGSGVLRGLTVLNLDGLSILVESGAAIDSKGREIIVGSSVVKKISALPGFQEQGVDRFSLCLEYREDEVQPIYAVNRKEGQNEYENNRIQESYELRLIDTADLERAFRLDSEFFVETRLFHTRDYIGTLKMPAVACKGRKVRMELEVEKLSDREETLNLAYELQLPAFSLMDGGQALEIEKRIELCLTGEKQKLDYWLFCMPSGLDETSILSKPVKKWKDYAEELELKIRLTQEEPESLIRWELGKTGLEIRERTTHTEAVRLADLYIRHTDMTCMIEQVDESVRQYIPLPSEEVKKSEYLSFYALAGEPQRSDSKAEGSGPEEHDYTKQEPDLQPPVLMPAETEVFEIPSEWPEISCGTLEIPLDEFMQEGDVCYSGEIIHGLGPGNVYVAVGLDETEEGVKSLRKIPGIIYGDATLFTRQDPTATDVTTAVKVWTQRGCFQVAVRLNGKQNTVLLSMHWIAWKYPESSENEFVGPDKQRFISPEEMTVNLKPGEKHFFAVSFHNMKPCSLRYELTEEHTGMLDEDGTYKAPQKPGVYEIKISCDELPEIYTYTYAVVSR